MENNNDKSKNDESSCPSTSQDQDKEKSKAEITDGCTPASSQIQPDKSSNHVQTCLPRKEERKCCSHKLRQIALHESSKASNKVEQRPGTTADKDEVYSTTVQDEAAQGASKLPRASEDQDEPRPGTSQGTGLQGSESENEIDINIPKVSQDSGGTGFLVGQYSSISQEPSGIELLVGQYSGFSQLSSDMESLVEQRSITPQKSIGSALAGEQPSSRLQKSYKIELLNEQLSKTPQKSGESELLAGREASTADDVKVRSRLSAESVKSGFNIGEKSFYSELSKEGTSSPFDVYSMYGDEKSNQTSIFLNNEQLTIFQERKRTRSESKGAQVNIEPLPPKKPRLEFENQDDSSPEDAEHIQPEDGISIGLSFKTNEVLNDGVIPVTSKPLTPKTKESGKATSAAVDRKMKKPKHPKRAPILLEAPVTEKYTVFMKNDKWKVVGGGMQGWRIRMEDAHVTLLETPLDPTVAFFGVFDGHGGNEVSNFVARHLYKFILQSDRFHIGDIDFAIKEGYMNIDKHMRENDIGKFRQGTTAITLMIKDQTVYCANVGDSRAIAVIDGFVVPLSVDQKPTLPEEAKRISLAGLPILNNRVSGGLAMSRSLGDFRYKSFRHLSALQQPVIAQPEIIKKSLTDSWEFVVIACDGIWDVMSNDLVAAFVKEKIQNEVNLNEICEALFMKCLAPSAFFPNKGCDNMTAVIILFSEEMTKSTSLRLVTGKEENVHQLKVNG